MGESPAKAQSLQRQAQRRWPSGPRLITCGARGTAGLMGGELPPVHVSWAHTLLPRLGSGPETRSECVVRELDA